jgi:hypothetical protein
MMVPAMVVLAMSAASSVQAGQFGVRVVDQTGEPVAGAAVCVGLEGNYKQFGALFTDLNGEVPLLEVPNVPLVLTVSKTRFTGVRLMEPSRGYNLVKEVRLRNGLPGPRCRAESSLASAPAILIGTIEVTESGSSTTLTPTVTGDPSHYRVSQSDQFSDTNWERFKKVIALSNSLSGRDSVFLQLRKIQGTSKSWLESRSDIINVPLQTQTR